MKRRILSMTFVLCMLLTLLPTATVSAYSDVAYPVEGGNLYFAVFEEYAKLTDCDKTVTVARIPEEINGVPVTEISFDAFSECASLTDIYLPKTITSLQELHEREGSSGVPVHAKNGIWVDADNPAYSSDENGVLFNKDKTKLLKAPYALRGTYRIPEGVTTIRLFAFNRCTAMTEVVIPETVTTLGGHAFQGCTALESVTLPKSITSYCDEEGPGLFSVGMYFEGCTALKNVTLAEGLTSLGGCMFFGCTSLTEIIIPASVSYIESYAFENCTNLTTVRFMGNAPEIGERVFQTENGENLPKLTLYYIDGKSGWTTPTWNGYPTAVCMTYAVENGNLYFDSTGTVYDCDKTVTAVKTPASIGGVAVTRIGESAFEECTALTEVSLPDSVTTIEREAFALCRSLQSVTLPATLTVLSACVFFDCRALEHISIPSTVTRIETQAFCYTALQELALPKDLNYLGPEAFCGTELRSVVVPDGITTLHYATFMGCSLLESVQLPETLETIGVRAFWHCRSLKNIHIPDSVTAIENQAFMNTALETVVIPAGVTVFYPLAFKDCAELSAVCFKGNAPTVLYESVQSPLSPEDCVPPEGLTLYHTEGASGWTSPLWNDFPTATWDGANLPHTHSYQEGKCTVCGAADPSYSALDSAAVFKDVGQNDWYKTAVDYAINHELFNGTSSSTFEPEGEMTRAMLVTVLWRSAGKPVEGMNTFSDVPNDQYYAQPVAWAAANGIVTGTSSTTFAPDDNVTREQLATILYRYTTKTLGVDVSTTGDLTKFSDHAKANDWAIDALKWAVGVGIISGDKQGNTVYLDPQGNATRAQVATIFMRYLETVAK